MQTDYIGHDQKYKQIKAQGGYGWTSEADQAQVVRPRILQAINQFSLPPGSRILDLGCGAGDTAIWLAQLGYEAHGIDIAPTAIAWAKEKAEVQQAQVRFTLGSVLNLQAYSDEFFHLVADGRCLHCIIGEDRKAVLASVYRVLQAGGRFLVQTMCGEVMEASPAKAEFDPVSRCTINAQGIATRYIGQATEIARELQAAGFKVEDWEVIPRLGEEDQDDLVARAIKEFRR